MRWFCLIRQVLMAAVGLSCLGTATLGLPDSSTELLKIFLSPTIVDYSFVKSFFERSVGGVLKGGPPVIAVIG